jgi:hypothetical protein
VVTVERLHQLIDTLPEAERETAAHLLEALIRPAGSGATSGEAFFDRRGPAVAVLNPDVPELQDIDELRGDFWPDDEGPDDFVNAVHAWRCDGDRA